MKLLYKKLKHSMGISGHILDPYCVRLLNAAPFCENYMKLWCNAKHLGGGGGGGGGGENGENFGALFS